MFHVEHFRFQFEIEAAQPGENPETIAKNYRLCRQCSTWNIFCGKFGCDDL